MKVCRETRFIPRTTMKLRSQSSYSRYDASVYPSHFSSPPSSALSSFLKSTLFRASPSFSHLLFHLCRKYSCRRNDAHCHARPFFFRHFALCTLVCTDEKKKKQKLAQMYCSNARFFSFDFSSRPIFLLFLSPNSCKTKITSIINAQNDIYYLKISFDFF